MRIAVVALGKVGLPLAVQFASSGHELIGVDVNVSEGDTTRYSFAKREPLRVEHEAFRDAVLGKQTDVVTMAQGSAPSLCSTRRWTPHAHVPQSASPWLEPIATRLSGVLSAS